MLLEHDAATSIVLWILTLFTCSTWVLHSQLRHIGVLCEQLCSIFRVPIAIVSLIDTERQWFKSAQGLPGVSQTSRATSFCAWTLLPKNPEVLIVTDATKDER